MREVDLAWLAGLLDGEGSVGASLCHKPERARPWSIRPAIQMSITVFSAIERAVAICDDIGVTAATYTYIEKVPAKQLPYWRFAVMRLADIRILAREMLPYSIVKQQHFEVILALVESRLANVELDDRGRIRRGGTRANPYTAEQVELAKILRNLNVRGPRKEVPWHDVARVSPR